MIEYCRTEPVDAELPPYGAKCGDCMGCQLPDPHLFSDATVAWCDLTEEFTRTTDSARDLGCDAWMERF